MERRRFLVASGSTILAGTALNSLQRPAVGLDFEISIIPNRKPSDVDSILIEFTNLEITPSYLDDSEDLDIKIELDIDGKDPITKTVSSLSFTNNQTIDSSYISSKTGTDLSQIVINGIQESDNDVEGVVRIIINHPEISEKLYKQSFSINNAFDLTNRSKVASYDTGANIQSHKFTPDGLTLYTSDNGGFNEGNIIEHELTKAFDITTASVKQTISSPGAFLMEFNDDGTVFNILDYQNSYYAYNLTTPYNVSTKTNERTQNVLDDEEGFAFNGDGGEIHICRRDSREIEVYELSTAFDSTTRGNLKYSFSTNVSGGDFMDLIWNDDGTKYYTLYRYVDGSDDEGLLRQLSVPTPYDPRNPTLEHSKTTELDDGVDNDQKTISWSPDGKHFHHTLYDSKEIYQWELSLP